LFAICLVAAILLTTAYAAEAQETRYLYDPLGRLVGVVSPDGSVTIYEYDAVGNLLAVRRPEAPGPVAITLVRPGIGTVGTRVEIFGVGFSAVPSENQVAFNTVTAQVLTATPTHILTEVPAGATSGPITLTTPLASAVSPDHFRIPGIAVSPAQAVVVIGKSRQFTATVADSSDKRVTWSVNGVHGGDATVGTVTLDGLYRAPAQEPIPSVVQVRATSVPFPALFAEAVVVIMPPPPSAVVAVPSDIRVVRPGTGDPGGLAANVTMATPWSITVVRPGMGDPGGVGVNVTVASPPSITVVRPGRGDPGGLGLNLTAATPPAITVVRPGSGDPGGLSSNTTVASPPTVTVVRPGTGDPGGLSPNTTVGQPHDVQVRRQ
jgi:YD repeat-containing protein